ncbi:hypothetical protein K439DRAFT_1660935 [Ramaria rubella]|nr:hypothetical protein K439DRAFT_1660935 [Ramaria rubella]
MGDVTLWCLVIDDALEPVGGAFDLNAPPDDRFGDLADKIIVKATIESKPKATGLTLWKLSDEWKLALYPLESLKSNLKQLHLDRESGKETNNKAFWLSPIQKISKVFNKELEEDDCAHILVQLPVQTIRSRGANKRLRDEASDVLNRLRAKKTRVQLPPLRDLLSILDRPFDETEKIAVSHDSYDDLITPKFYNNDICEEADVALLFKRSEIDAISPLILSLYAEEISSAASSYNGSFLYVGQPVFSPFGLFPMVEVRVFVRTLPRTTVIALVSVANRASTDSRNCDKLTGNVFAS